MQHPLFDAGAKYACGPRVSNTNEQESASLALDLGQQHGAGVLCATPQSKVRAGGSRAALFSGRPDELSCPGDHRHRSEVTSARTASTSCTPGRRDLTMSGAKLEQFSTPTL